jgi:hypothetical protein
MSNCQITFRISNTTIILNCHLAEHSKVLEFHYDKDKALEWRYPLKPVPLPSTRTTSPRQAAKSAANHTTAFEVIS